MSRGKILKARINLAGLGTSNEEVPSKQEIEAYLANAEQQIVTQPLTPGGHKLAMRTAKNMQRVEQMLKTIEGE